MLFWFFIPFSLTHPDIIGISKAETHSACPCGIPACRGHSVAFHWGCYIFSSLNEWSVTSFRHICLFFQWGKNEPKKSPAEYSSDSCFFGFRQRIWTCFETRETSNSKFFFFLNPHTHTLNPHNPEAGSRPLVLWFPASMVMCFKQEMTTGI